MAELVRKTLEINKELVDWVESTYPGTSFTFLINRSLEMLKRAHDENPIDYAAIGAKYMLEEIQSGGS